MIQINHVLTHTHTHTHTHARTHSRTHTHTITGNIWMAGAHALFNCLHIHQRFFSVKVNLLESLFISLTTDILNKPKRSAAFLCNPTPRLDRYLVFYAQWTAKGHIGAKENLFLPQVQILIHYSTHIPPLRIENNCWKWSWMSREVRK